MSTNLNRRKFLGAVSVGGSMALAGCQSHTISDTTKTRADSGGPQINYEKHLSVEDGETKVELKLRAWYQCSFVEPEEMTEKPYVFTVYLIAAGEVVVEDTWVVEFKECMQRHTDERSYILEKEYDSVSVYIKGNE